MQPLASEFHRIKTQHRTAIKKTIARLVLGPSVIRVYAKGTREALLPYLPTIDVNALPRMRCQEHFSAWFDEHVDRIARILRQRNPRNSRIRPGIAWGHATKILALFVRDLVVNSHYFPDAQARRIAFFLHVPIDSIVIKRLRKLGLRPVFKRIKDVDTRERFYEVQETLGAAALAQGIPRVWFDDNWGDRQ